MADLDLLGPLHDQGEELLVDALVDQQPRRTGADLPLVQGEHHRAFQRLVQELVILQAAEFMIKIT